MREYADINYILLIYCVIEIKLATTIDTVAS